ncbi:hypothetical protein LPJ55_001113 [Coemansia sp. RSA 990]|nr:hypothetical protein LPJ55_001113 [Coemansia sp. RSA 990]
MSSSLFQLFPENIATTIVRHLVSSTACSTALQAIPPAVSALNALLQVNKLWRKAVLDCVYEKCVISINRQNKLDTSVSPMIPLAGKLPLSDICDKVRHLQLNVDCNFIDLQIYLDNWNPKAGTVLRNVECVEFVLVSSISNIDRHMVLQQSYGTAFEHVSMEELGKVAFGLAPNIYTLELTGTRSNSDFFAYIPADAQLNSLRSVFMPAIDMDLSDVVYLLKSAPAVEELKCSSIIIGNELEEIEPAKWPDFVYENCHPLGPNFSKLTVSKLTSVWRQARVFMLIAIMCPSMRRSTDIA